jgi:two-component system cell cycle response regulator DivK
MRRPLRVLLVDDDRDSREICGEFLVVAGYEVVQAANGAEGVAAAIARRPDVVVMDLDMPVMGGLEAIRRLKAEPRTRALPVIVLSASAVVEHGNVARAGCPTCLAKPCDLDDLQGVIQSLVDVPRLERLSGG